MTHMPGHKQVVGNGLIGPTQPNPTPPTLAQIIPGTTAREYLQQLITNAALPHFAEQRTQAETARWLARANPNAYGHMRSSFLPGPAALQGVTPGGVMSNVENFLSGLGFDKLTANVPQDVKAKLFGAAGKETDIQKQAVADAKAGIQWLRQMLQTTSPALQKGQTREQRALALGHATTLMKEAEREPSVGGLYTTLAENLVNPITRRPMFTGTPLGSMRALSSPAGTFRRGGTSLRNVGLT